MTAEISVLSPDELLRLAATCGETPQEIVRRWAWKTGFSWDWPVDGRNRLHDVIRIWVEFNTNQIATDKYGIIWIRPHRLVIQRYTDKIPGERIERYFQQDTPLGIENGLPRPALATLITRKLQLVAA